MALRESPVGLMKSQMDIEKLAQQKLAAARALLDNGHLDDAYYLAGYSIELYLKASICKTLGADDFFMFDKLSSKENYRAFRNHNYKDLLVFSGLQPAFEVAVQEPDFAVNWTTVKKWNVKYRYVLGQYPGTVKDFLNSSQIICTWIQKHL